MKVLALIIICSLVLASLFFVIKDWGNVEDVKLLSEDKITQDIEPDCKNFNGKDFLTSGGSKTPTTYSEIQEELKRLKWLCSGGD